MSSLITVAFERIGSATWVQESRRGPKEFFGYSPGDVLPKRLFEGRIPADIGEAFGYLVKMPLAEARFGRFFYNSFPLSAQTYLNFGFPDSSAMLIHLENIDGGGKRVLLRSSEGLGMYRRSPSGFSERNTFTVRGRKMMEDLFRAGPKILAIPGLKKGENKMLNYLLFMVQKEYRAGKIEPRET